MKHQIVQFVQEFHKQNGRAPSVNEILKHFKNNGLCSSTFYQFFPKGLKELCSLAGIPVPVERIRKTAKATAALREGRKGDVHRETALSRLILTEEQTKRLLGLSHLEGGRDPLLIMDQLLDLDTVLRKEFKLTLEDIARVAVFLKYAVSIGWRIKQDPDLLDCLTRAWNLGLLGLEPRAVQYLVEVLEDAQARGWKPNEFANYVTKFYNGILAYIMYEKGLICFEEFRRRVETHV